MKRIGNEREDEALLIALTRLEGEPALAPVRAWLADSLRELERQCSTEHDEVVLRQRQGGAHEVRELIERFEGARDHLTRLRSRQ